MFADPSRVTSFRGRLVQVGLAVTCGRIQPSEGCIAVGATQFADKDAIVAALVRSDDQLFCPIHREQFTSNLANRSGKPGLDSRLPNGPGNNSFLRTKLFLLLGQVS